MWIRHGDDDDDDGDGDGGDNDDGDDGGDGGDGVGDGTGLICLHWAPPGRWD